ncbi:MAG: lactate utilization protein C, partial [Marmoricola sp.]
MSARDEILARVRSATSGRTAPTVDRGYRASAPLADLLGRFVERVEDYQASVVRCSVDQAAEVIAAAVAGLRVVVPEGLGWPVAGAVRDDGLSHLDLDGLDGVVTGATVAVAETGTI